MAQITSIKIARNMYFVPILIGIFLLFADTYLPVLLDFFPF